MQSLPRRLSHCSLAGESFEQGAEYISVLDLEGNRKDFCPECWKKTDKPIEGHFWKGKIPFKKEKILNPDERALHFFRQTDNPKQRFVLALYLQRKQQLVKRTQTLYEIPETGEVFDVERVFMSKEEGEAIGQEISLLLTYSRLSLK